MPRILALDVGKKRIGIAISDALNITAQGKKTIERKNTEDTLTKIRTIIEEHKISEIVVGMPFNMNGTKGSMAKLVEEFIFLLKKDFPVNIKIIDERLTTQEGERLLLEADVSRKKRKYSIDKIAAQLILQTYLDSDRNLKKNHGNNEKEFRGKRIKK